MEDRRSHERLCAALSAGRRRETNSGCKERRQVVLDQAWLTDARLLAKHRRQARRSPHRPVTGEDLLAAGEQHPLPGGVGVFVRARVLARGVVGGEGLVSRLDQTIQRALAVRSGRSRPVGWRGRRMVPFASRRAASGHSGAGGRSACGDVRCGRTRSAPPRSPRPLLRSGWRRAQGSPCDLLRERGMCPAAAGPPVSARSRRPRRSRCARCADPASETASERSVPASRSTAAS